ncbi:hypothetical protein OG400_19385 [Micromonospora ureilytica]|uniref:hypothetical protein n=1 Tax=Micromonospora ureilytica TaxID=709868 RepID=UPI002E128A96|nr:hypothetical protein OG400_19385 [Micromonospora ureilytica]
MNSGTPYAAVLLVEDAVGRVVLDVLTEAFSIDPVSCQVASSRWLVPGWTPDAEHPDAPEVVGPSWRAGSFSATRRPPQNWCAAHSWRGAARMVDTEEGIA